VNVIAALAGTFCGVVAKGETSTIPIVFLGTADPVKLGLITSLNRPGGNVTGVVLLAVELLTKRLQLLIELIPNDGTISVLVNPKNPNTKAQLSEVQSAAQSLARRIAVVNASGVDELDAAFVSLAQHQAQALLLTSDVMFSGQPNKIAAPSVRHAMPAVFEKREFAEAGGLMNYGTSVADGFRQAGIYVARILKGEKPVDLPVQQSRKVELVINLRPAKALRLTIPPSLLARADEVIE